MKKTVKIIVIMILIIVIGIIAILVCGKMKTQKTKATNKVTITEQTEENVDFKTQLEKALKTQNITMARKLFLKSTYPGILNFNNYIKNSPLNLIINSEGTVSEDLLERFKEKYPDHVEWDKLDSQNINAYDITAINSETLAYPFEAYILTTKNQNNNEKIIAYSNALLIEDFNKKSSNLTFDTYARNMKKYSGTRIKGEGEVVQILYYEDNGWELRINVTKDEYNLYSDTIYATYLAENDEDKILENDIIEFEETLIGDYSYTSAFNTPVQLPYMVIYNLKLKN